MTQTPYVLDELSRAAVLEAIQEACQHRSWRLLAAHVRTTHVHVIVDAEAKPEKVLNDLKSYATRRLNAIANESGRKRWARHGSTRWLWKDQDVREAIRYIVENQGKPMALFVAHDL
jgi:REP element-mobilizing transposase RayT